MTRAGVRLVLLLSVLAFAACDTAAKREERERTLQAVLDEIRSDQQGSRQSGGHASSSGGRSDHGRQFNNPKSRER